MTGGVRRLTHEEAEMLISARMDEHLDRADSRALLVHLQTCESCRAFAVQTEVLGRGLEALPVLPASPVVDRGVREAIATRNRRWSFPALFPAGGGGASLRAAAGALAILALVSVYLLIRMAGGQSGIGPAIDAPNGGLAQQIERTVTSELAMASQATGAGPTETPRVVAPPAQSATAASTTEPVRAGSDLTEPTAQDEALPTATLDPAFVYVIDKTRTPSAGHNATTPTLPPPVPSATEESGDVMVAAIGGEEGTPADTLVETATTAPTEPSGTPAEDGAESTAPVATETPIEPVPPATQEQATEEPATEEPTMTATPVEISVAGAEASREAETQTPEEVPATESAGEATSAPAPKPAETPIAAPKVASPTAAPGEVAPEVGPTEGPFVQPTIAPMSGRADTGADTGSGGDGQGDHQDNAPVVAAEAGTMAGDGQSPPIQPIDGSDVQGASSVGDGSGGSPQIVSTDDSTGSGTGVAVGATTETAGVGGETQPEAPVIATVDGSAEPAGLDLSKTVTSLPTGTSSPPGRLAFSPGMSLYVVTAPDGQLAVADLEGEIVITLGAGALPVWSGPGLMFAAPSDNGTRVGIWNSDTGDLAYIPASEDEATSDLPIGGGGQAFYFLRTFPDRPGAMEIHNATIDGSDEDVIWSADAVELGGARPVWSSDGILLPAVSEWLRIGFDGSETELGENPYGAIGAPILSPGQGLMAYSAGDQVIVAWTETPGEAVATAPFGGSTGGYAFSTSGEQIVVSDGSALHVVSYQGDDLGTLSGNQPLGGVYWVEGAIYYLQIGEDAALRSTSLSAIQGDR